MNKEIIQNSGSVIVESQNKETQGFEEQRSVAQVKAAILMAKTHPRNETEAYNKILRSCERKSFAESAMFGFPRGGTLVTGPSIRMAETMARCWGNIDFGIQVLSQDERRGVSEVMAYAWDIENNVRQTRVFTVAHKRKARGKFEKITDPRDIYEYEANLGARRVRACILGLLPDDIIEAAEEACDKTMQGNSGEPMSDRIRNMVKKFETVDVSQSELEEYLGHSVDGIIPVRLADLGKIFNSIKNGIATKNNFFGKKDDTDASVKALTDELKNKKGSDNE